MVLPDQFVAASPDRAGGRRKNRWCAFCLWQGSCCGRDAWRGDRIAGRAQDCVRC